MWNKMLDTIFLLPCCFSLLVLLSPITTVTLLSCNVIHSWIWVKNLSILICQFFFYFVSVCQTFFLLFKAKVVQKGILIRVVKEKKCHKELLNKMKFRRIQKRDGIFLDKQRETSTIDRYMSNDDDAIKYKANRTVFLLCIFIHWFPIDFHP